MVGQRYAEALGDRQQLAGHLNEAKNQLAQFQQLAELHHNGDLALLVRAYKNNHDPSVVDTATIIEQLLIRISYLEQHLHNLLSPQYWLRLKSVLLDGDVAIMQRTAHLFKLAIPLELTALTTGLIIALTFMILASFAKWLLAKLANAKPEYN